VTGLRSGRALAFPAWARISPARVRHVEGVTGLLAEWADALGVPDDERERWLRAGLLHDAVKDAAAEDLAALTDVSWGVPKLLHGPAAAVLAESFYREQSRRRDPVAALAGAQREVLADPRFGAPYYWAGYEVLGAGTGHEGAQAQPERGAPQEPDRLPY